MSLITGISNTNNTIALQSDTYTPAPYKNQPVLNTGNVSQYCFRGTPKDVKRRLQSELAALEDEEKAVQGQGLRGQEASEQAGRCDIEKTEKKLRADIATSFARQGQTCLLSDMSRKRKSREIALAENRIASEGIISEIVSENDFFLLKYAEHASTTTSSTSTQQQQQFQSLRRSEVSSRMQLASVESMDRLRISRFFKLERVKILSTLLTSCISCQENQRTAILQSETNESRSMQIQQVISHQNASLLELEDLQSKTWLHLNNLWWNDLRTLWTDKYNIDLPSLSPKPPKVAKPRVPRYNPTMSVATMKRDPVYAMERVAILRIIQQHRELQQKITMPTASKTRPTVRGKDEVF
eukprot:TRINITY_DN13428_c0_g1_i1.p1 TRINITY_DN13428_c0_g1~~TRINITY_DN13428_c0_g1_i1.p1  ORF type:complete len:355 (+),score=52.18 TRINITY_DN13428_c0_g1_i1:47-1111(+)